jgi:hypothetical protein
MVLKHDRSGAFDPDANEPMVAAFIKVIDRDSETMFIQTLERVLPDLRRQGAEILGCFVTDTSPNTFTRLPVIENEHVLVWFARFPDQTAHHRLLAHLREDPDRHAKALDLLASAEIWRLTPTVRSAVGH